MKLSLMRSALVLALALGLASCGGKAGFTIAGEVSGLQYTGLKLSTNGMTIPVEPRSPATVEKRTNTGTCSPGRWNRSALVSSDNDS